MLSALAVDRLVLHWISGSKTEADYQEKYDK